MEICGLVEAKLIRRVNRFVLEIEIDGSVQPSHLRDPGRLTELMKQGNRVLVRPKKRKKTNYEVFVIYDGDVPVVVNSAIHSDVAAEILEKEGFKIERRELKVGKSRIDFLVSKNGVQMLVEVKGCTLVKDGVALFPDAPTERGVKHVREIMERGGMLLFLVMRNDATLFMPNRETHEEFADVLKETYDCGVEVRAALMKPRIDGGCLKIEFDRYLPVKFL